MLLYKDGTEINNKIYTSVNDLALLYQHKMWGGYNGFALSRPSVLRSVRPWVGPSVSSIVSAL